MNTPSAIMQEMSEKMEKPKLCKDCKFFKKGFFEPSCAGKCMKVERIDVVTGEKELGFCYGYRFDFPGNCGSEGKYWEAK